MPLLIDCYNVLHTTMPPRLAGLDEAGLCRALSRSVFANQNATVVCDGRVKPHGLDQSPVDGVDLVYSGPRRSADDVIVEMIGTNTAPRRLIVVSNDRQIRKAARRRRAQVLSCERFIGALATPADGGAPVGQSSAKPGDTLGPDEVDGWLEAFGLEGDDAIEPHRDWWDW